MTSVSRSSFRLACKKSVRFGLTVICLAGAGFSHAGTLERVTENTYESAISGDGRVAAFARYPALGPVRLFFQELDGNSAAVGFAGQSGYSYAGLSLSHDGRYIAFQSSDNSLVADDTNNRTDIFVYDRQLGQIKRVSVSSAGDQSNHHSRSPDISADGRYVVFSSYADNLAADTNAGADIFLHDTFTGSTKKVSVDSAGRDTNGANKEPVISANGKFVAFTSNSSAYVSRYPYDVNGDDDVFLHSIEEGTTTRVSTAVNQTRSTLDPTDFQGFKGFSPSISDDGRYVLYNVGIRERSLDHNRFFSLRLRDTVNNITSDVIVGVDGLPANFDVTGAVISADGRFVAFQSAATNLLSSPINSQNNIFVTDLYSDTTQLVTTASSGTQANAYSRSPVISADGGRIIFQTLANNLVTLNVDPNDFGRTASILYKNTIGDSQAPASVTVPADNCQYYNASIHQGWGWDPVTRQSCPPRNNVGCDYTQANIHDGWGWNAGTGQSCPPLNQ